MNISQSAPASALAVKPPLCIPNINVQPSTSENICPSIRVNVGFDVDENIKMILEMDPSIVDFGFENIAEYTPSETISGLPPQAGRYV